MRKEDIKKGEVPPELPGEKFVYVKGNISRLGPEEGEVMVDGEIHDFGEGIKKLLKEHRCPRCEGKIPEGVRSGLCPGPDEEHLCPLLIENIIKLAESLGIEWK